MRNIINKIKNFLWLRTEVVLLVQFDPIKKEVNKNLLFSDQQIAVEWYKYIYNHLVESMNGYNVEYTKAYQELLRNAVLSSEAHGSKIPFNKIHWEKI